MRRAGGAAAATAFVSPGPCLPTSSAAGEGGRESREGRPGGRSPHPRRPHAGYCPRLCVVRESRGPRRQDDASVFVFPELAGGLPSPGRRHPRPARAPPESQGPRAHPGRHAPPGALSLRPTLTLREQEAEAGPARDAGAVGPGRSLRLAGRARIEAAGGGGAATAAGAFFCSSRSPERGRDAAELGKWEEGSEGEAEGEAEGGPEAAAANAARGARPSSPHASAGGG